MNKKNLSVVMAGAMLATSVAPVLADTTATEVGLSQKASLRNQIKNKMAEKYLTTNSVLLNDGTQTYLSNEVKAELDKTNKASAYGIKVLDTDGKVVDLNTIDGSISSNTKVTYKETEMEKVLNSDKLKAGYTIQVLERYTTEFMGQIIPGSALTVKTAAGTYTASDIETPATTMEGDLQPSSNKNYVKSLTSVDLNEDGTSDAVEVTLNKLKDINDSTSNEKLTIKVDDKRLDGNLPVDKDGNLLDLNEKSDIQKFDHFAEKVTYNVSNKVANEPTLVASYKLVDDNKDDSKENLTVADLYDGFALTARGTEILSDLSNAAKNADEKIGDNTNSLVQLSEVTTDGSTGVSSFTVTYYKNSKDEAAGTDKASKVITVRTTNLKEINSLHELLKSGTFNVGIVGGDNRYETAVNVAKAQNLPKIASGNATTDGDEAKNNIVLVNGTSLVDGLSAAPLAGTLKINDTKGTAVLLSEKDKLPTATKEYLEYLSSDIAPAKRKYITINLVGGESVLSASLENELKNMGFNVVRFGGDNREETSIEVAEAMVKSNVAGKGNAFVVGGNGEADAMSISSVAVNKETPIIVSSVHGLTNDGVKYIKNNALNGDITIVGGESVVSKEEENKINIALESKNSASRISGDNRFETNAKVIKEYYKTGVITGVKGVVLVKDGQSNKSELIDALSAANYAASTSMNAPIVLASGSLKDSQKNALLNMNVSGTISTDGTVAQVGIGAERTTLETIANLFGISNTK